MCGLPPSALNGRSSSREGKEQSPDPDPPKSAAVAVRKEGRNASRSDRLWKPSDIYGRGPPIPYSSPPSSLLGKGGGLSSVSRLGRARSVHALLGHLTSSPPLRIRSRRKKIPSTSSSTPDCRGEKREIPHTAMLFSVYL